MASAYELVSAESRSLPFQGSLMQAKPAIIRGNGTLSAGTRKTALTYTSPQAAKGVIFGGRQVLKDFANYRCRCRYQYPYSTVQRACPSSKDAVDKFVPFGWHHGSLVKQPLAETLFRVLCAASHASPTFTEGSVGSGPSVHGQSVSTIDFICSYSAA